MKSNGLVVSIFLIFLNMACDPNDEPAFMPPPVPDAGVYLTTQYQKADLTFYKDVVYSVRHNYNQIQFTDINTKSTEKGTDELTIHLDIAVPPNATASSSQPLIVLVHGGGFITGTKNDMQDNALTYALAGYVSATINYRLTSNNKENEVIRTLAVTHAVEDGMNAIRFLKANAARYHIDTTRVAAIGGSAGGGITLTNAVAADELPDLVSDYPGYSGKVQASISTGATLTSDSLVDKSLLVYDASDSPVLLFHNSIQDPVTGATWSDVLQTQKYINDAGNECIVVAQPSDSHTVNLSVGSTYWNDVKSFLWLKLKLYEK